MEGFIYDFDVQLNVIKFYLYNYSINFMNFQMYRISRVGWQYKRYHGESSLQNHRSAYAGFMELRLFIWLKVI